MPKLPLTREEQFEILENDRIAEAVAKYLNGIPSRVGELFSISKEEYFQWEFQRPLKEDGWLRTSPNSQDGVYFLQGGESWWTIYQQDRGAILWKESFDTYAAARRYFALEYGLGRHLRDAV